MSSPCLSGRAYGLELEMVKPPPSSSSTTTTIRTSHPSSSSSSSSTTSTISVEAASNSPLAISTRKPRTPRKRPNQTYHEAAAILSSAYPNIFSGLHNHTSYNSIHSYNNNKNISNNNNISYNYPRKFIKPDHHQTNILLVDDPSDLLLPFRVFDNSGFLLHQPIVREKAASFFSEPKLMTSFTSPHHKSCQNNGGFGMGLCEEDDLDAESILDEEVEEGIDSIMGNLTVTNNGDSSSSSSSPSPSSSSSSSCWFNGYPMGLNFGMMKGIKAMRHVDDGNRWSFPVVDVLQISPRLNNSDTHKGSCPVPDSKAQNSNSTKVKLKLRSRDSLSEKKKSKTTAEKPPPADAASEQQMKDSEKVKEKESGGSVANTNSNSSTTTTTTSSTAGLLLKLNYDDVLNAWSDRESPFSDEIEGSDVSARLAQIDLWGESGGGVREASVLRYKEKRRNRLFSKKIRYQIRKLNADRRPRMQGRFVRRPNAISTSKQR